LGEPDPKRRDVVLRFSQNPWEFSLIIDGQDISNIPVCGIQVNVNAGEIPKVALDVEAIGGVSVELPDCVLETVVSDPMRQAVPEGSEEPPA